LENYYSSIFKDHQQLEITKV